MGIAKDTVVPKFFVQFSWDLSLESLLLFRLAPLGIGFRPYSIFDVAEVFCIEYNVLVDKERICIFFRFSYNGSVVLKEVKTIDFGHTTKHKVRIRR